MKTPSIHNYIYFISPKDRDSSIECITGQVGVDERLYIESELRAGLIECVIAEKNLNCSPDELRVHGLISLPKEMVL